MEDKRKTTGIGDLLAEGDKNASAWLAANGFPDDLDRAVKIAVAELGEFVTSQDIADFPLDNIWDLLQTCVDRREWLEARLREPVETKHVGTTSAQVKPQKIIMPTNEDVARVCNFVAEGMPVQTAAKKVAENSEHSFSSLKTLYYKHMKKQKS